MRRLLAAAACIGLCSVQLAAGYGMPETVILKTMIGEAVSDGRIGMQAVAEVIRRRKDARICGSSPAGP